MRDAHRMKEKYDLSLDNRQIVSLLIGGIVVIGAVFVLGVVVGKKLSESGRADTAPNLLATLDEKAAAMEKVKKEPELTFERELTKPGSSVVTLPKPQPPPAAEKPPEVAAAKPSPEPAAEEAKPAEPKAEPAKTETAKAAPAKVEPKPAEPPKVAAAEPKKPEPAVAKAAPKVEPAAAKAAPKIEQAHATAKVEPAGQGGFTLQLSASPSRAEADKFAQSVKDKGYAPYIVEAEVPGKGTFYRVRLGRFASKEAAQKYLADFKRETQMPAFVAAAN